MDDIGGDDWFSVVAGNSEMGADVLAFDWAATPVGPLSAWPHGLRAAVSICMTTSFPAYVAWGAELISIYNDEYRAILGHRKHPAALGTPACAVWPEVWDDVGAFFDSVVTTAQPLRRQNHRLVIERSGFPEECFFTFSYSPLFQADAVGGVLALVVETTDQIVTARRLACLAALNSALVDAEQVTHVCLAASTALAEFSDDVRFADVYLRAGERPVLLASTRGAGMRRAVEAGLAERIAGETVVVGGDGTGSVPADIVALPIGGRFERSTETVVRGALVLGLNRSRPFDRPYEQFVEALADAVSSALDGAYRRTVELGEYRRVSDTLQAAMLPPAQDLPTIAARYIPAVGSLAVGGDWYDVIDVDESRRALVVGDCVGHGLEAATVMGQLRAAARAMLLDGHTPAQMLTGLDTFAAEVEGALCTTVICVVFDRSAGRITYARAGHPPALIVGPNGPRWLDQPGGPPLAVSSDVERHDTTLLVSDDEIIVMYSDGLIERRDEHFDAGMERLARAASAMLGERAHAIADGLLDELVVGDTTGDDIVVVVKHLISAQVP